MKRKFLFICLTVLFFLSFISGLSSGNASAAIVCLFLAAIFGFLTYRSFNVTHKSDAIKKVPAIQSNICTPPDRPKT